MSKAIRIHQPGDVSALKWDEVEVKDPAANEVKLRHLAVGVNFIDIYHRSGLYPVPQLPCVLGLEGAGEVTAVGSGVGHLKRGDLVAYATPPIGAYAEERLIPANRVVKLPPNIDPKTAAAIMLKGMTAEYLLHRTYKVKAGDVILVHAAAGGVGLLLCQWAKYLGATVIGTVSNAEKAELAKANGCDYPLIHGQDDWVSESKKISGGQGVNVVYDSIGKDSFTQSLDCLKPLGLMVSFGQSSGSIPPVDLSILSAKGSLFLTRPTLMTYIAQDKDLQDSAAALFEVVGRDVLRISVNQTYALKDAVLAHQDLEARRTTGSSILIP